MLTKHLNVRIYFKSSKISNAYELFHLFAENFIFFRWMFFKNRPRTTYLLVRSTMVNTMVFATYYAFFSKIKFLFMGIDVDPLLLYAGGVIIGYWFMSWTFGQKAVYLSNLYNDIIKEQGHGNHHTARMLSVNLAVQLLTLDLWGHRLYSWMLSETLEHAVQWAVQSKHQVVKGFDSFDDFVERANKGKLRIGEARSVLLVYQQHLAHFKDKQEREWVA
jgi:hypothetical protein